MVSGSISLPSPGFFSPFPHGTSSLSVAALYLALDRGRPGFGQGSSCPALLRYRIMEGALLRVRDCHPLRPSCPAGSAAYALLTPRVIPMRPYNPASPRFGLLRVRSPLLAESLLISVPGLLRWFTSPSVAPPDYFIHPRGARSRARVTPFGSPRIKGHVLLPGAFRSLSRPSSPCGSTGIRHAPMLRLTILPTPRLHSPRREALPSSFRFPPLAHSGWPSLSFSFPSLVLSNIARAPALVGD